MATYISRKKKSRNISPEVRVYIYFDAWGDYRKSLKLQSYIPSFSVRFKNTNHTNESPAEKCDCLGLNKSAFLRTGPWLWASCSPQPQGLCVNCQTAQAKSLLPPFCYFCLQTAIQLAFCVCDKDLLYPAYDWNRNFTGGSESLQKLWDHMLSISPIGRCCHYLTPTKRGTSSRLWRGMSARLRVCGDTSRHHRELVSFQESGKWGRTSHTEHWAPS